MRRNQGWIYLFFLLSLTLRKLYVMGSWAVDEVVVGNFDQTLSKSSFIPNGKVVLKLRRMWSWSVVTGHNPFISIVCRQLMDRRRWRGGRTVIASHWSRPQNFHSIPTPMPRPFDLIFFFGGERGQIEAYYYWNTPFVVSIPGIHSIFCFFPERNFFGV